MQPFGKSSIVSSSLWSTLSPHQAHLNHSLNVGRQVRRERCKGQEEVEEAGEYREHLLESTKLTCLLLGSLFYTGLKDEV